MRWRNTLFPLLFPALFLQQAEGQIPLGSFTEARNISRSIDENTFDFLPVISPDGLSLLFNDTPCEPWCAFWQPRQGGVGGEDIWIATRSKLDDDFSSVRNLEEVNSEAHDDMGGISADGLTIYFGSNRAGNWDLYQASRPDLDFPFDDVRPLGAGVNTDLIENSPVVTADGLRLFFHRADESDDEHDIMMAERNSTNDEFGKAVPLGESVDRYRTHFPSVSADGSAIFYSDWFWLEFPPRADGHGGADIWVTLKSDGEFMEPINLNDLGEGSSINRSQHEGTPYISADWPADGSKLYYVTDAAAGGFMDIYEATWRIQTLGDLSGDGSITAEDIDVLSRGTQQRSLNRAFDFDDSGTLDVDDRIVLIENLANTFVGDSTLDGEFNSVDLVTVFQAGEFEDDISENSSWATGDWNGDFEFTSSDFVLAFQRGGYEQGPRPGVAHVPEPSSTLLILSGLVLTVRRYRD